MPNIKQSTSQTGSFNNFSFFDNWRKGYRHRIEAIRSLYGIGLRLEVDLEPIPRISGPICLTSIWQLLPSCAGVPQHPGQQSAIGELRPVLQSAAVSPGQCVCAAGSCGGGLQRKAGVWDVLQPCQVRTLQQPRLRTTQQVRWS